MKRHLITLLLLLSFGIPQHSKEQDSSRISVSLLTCSPGEELYSIFGHSAIRIIDSNNVSDLVFNYGTFNFYDKNFYTKFIKGKLLYFVSIEKTMDFIEAYRAANRKVTEQLLQLSPEEKIAIKKALIENCREENKYYKYDFFYDNCTTRLRDILTKFKKEKIVLQPVMPANKTFRNAIHQYLDRSGQYWSKLGIDILLGARTDKIMSPSEQEFLPDNLMKGIENSLPHPLSAHQQVIVLASPVEKEINLLTPINLFALIFIIIFFLSLSKNNAFQKILTLFDVTLSLSLGVLGIILVLAWFCTDHSMTKNNYNLLWALPTHLLGCFFIFQKGLAAKRYFLINTLISCFLLAFWWALPQSLNPALIFITATVALRSFYRFKNATLVSK